MKSLRLRFHFLLKYIGFKRPKLKQNSKLQHSLCWSWPLTFEQGCHITQFPLGPFNHFRFQRICSISWSKTFNPIKTSRYIFPPLMTAAFLSGVPILPPIFSRCWREGNFIFHMICISALSPSDEPSTDRSCEDRSVMEEKTEAPWC